MPINDSYSRGSEWRKWDLHIHSPASYEWRDGKHFSEMTPQELDQCIDKIIEQINESDVACFSIMDYWTFDGYLEIQKFLSRNKTKSLKKALFPGIELRVEAPVDFRFNIHAILSDKLSDQQLSDFKSKLQIQIGTGTKNLSDEALREFASYLSPDKAKKHGFQDGYKDSPTELLRLGAMTAKVTKESLLDAIRSLPADSAYIIVPWDTSGGLLDLDWVTHPYDSSNFMNAAIFFEVRKPEYVQTILGLETAQNKSFLPNFITAMGGKPKPVLSGSDAHRIADYGVYFGDRIGWVKADPTFEGLRQLIHEPTDRCFIGTLPPKLQYVDQNKTRFIKSVSVKAISPDPPVDEWFNNDLELNSELVAVIGNKGSGKSALADIVGLLGNTRQNDAFSFLNDDKFRERKTGPAQKYKGVMTWLSGVQQEAKLSDDVQDSSVELVKYIPQNHLENICNETELNDRSLFNKELKNVIFSHITQSERLGCQSLDELLEFKTDEANQSLEILRSQLRELLQQIISIEDKLTEEYKQLLLNQLKQKTDELDAHDKLKPPEVLPPDPSSDSQEALSRSKKISEIKQSIESNQAELEKYEGESISISKQIAQIDKAVGQLDNFKRQSDSTLLLLQQTLSGIDLEIATLLDIKIDKGPLIELKSKKQKRQQEVTSALSPSIEDSTAGKKATLEKELKDLESHLDEPNRKYREYLLGLENWKKRRSEITGTHDTQGTIEYYNRQLSDVAGMPTKLSDLESQRDQKVREIYRCVSGLVKTYKELYAPVQHFVENNPISDDRFKMQFDVTISHSSFKEKLFALLLRNVIGSFYGNSEGEKMITSLLDATDFGSEDSAIEFTHTVLDHLRLDYRQQTKPKTNLKSQIRKGDVLGAYELIFSLAYLQPEYALKMSGKGLAQLSPGERGTLLLIFYLMVDKDEKPLILDQPEENLDNQTIYKVLVPCIKHAKTRRQIVLVTHNPNLAVVCDAEQVIVANIDKLHGNKVSYLTGSIENPVINRSIVDILEGTRPAFDNRDSKYLD